MNKYKKLFTNTIAMTIGQFSSKVLSFLLIPLYTSILSTQEYGVYDIIVTTVTLLTPFFTLVISEAVLRFAIDKNYKTEYVFTIGVLVVVLGSGFILLLSPIFALIPSVAPYRMWIAAFFFVMNLHTVLIQFLKGINEVAQYSVMGVISTIITLTLNICFLVFCEWGISGYLLATTMSHFLVSIIIIVRNKLWKYVVNPFNISKEIYTEMLRYGIPMIPNSISWWISDSSDKYMILLFMTSADVGLYSIAYKIPTILTTVMSLFISAFQISVFDDYKETDNQSFIYNIYTSTITILILFSSSLIFASKYIALVLYKRDFYSAWMIGCILILAFVFNSLSSIIGTLYTATKNTKILFYSTIVAAVINIIANIILIPIWGLYGAALATLFSYVCVWIIRGGLAQKELGRPFVDALSVGSMLLVLIQVTIEISSLQFKTIASLGIMLIICGITYVKIKKNLIINKILKVKERRR